MKVLITIKETLTATLDIGDLPKGLISDLLDKHDGSFDGNWGIYDVAGGNEERTVDSIEVVEL